MKDRRSKGDLVRILPESCWVEYDPRIEAGVSLFGIVKEVRSTEDDDNPLTVVMTYMGEYDLWDWEFEVINESR